MFLTDKYHALLPVHSAKDHRKAPAKAPPQASRFDAALAARLGSLLPLPASPLAALARLADLLAATLGDAVPALASATGQGDANAAVAAHLDAGVALLDACNTIAARVDCLRRLLTRLAVHLLSSPSPSSVQRVRRARRPRRPGRRGVFTSSAAPFRPVHRLAPWWHRPAQRHGSSSHQRRVLPRRGSRGNHPRWRRQARPWLIPPSCLR